MDKRDELKNKYFEDAGELIEEAHNVLLDVENHTENKGLLNRLLRAVHTLKGSSSFMGFSDISDFAHEIENVLSAASNGDVEFDEDSVDILYENLNILQKMIGEAKERGNSEYTGYMQDVEKLWNVVGRREDGGSPLNAEESVKSGREISPRGKNEKDLSPEVYISLKNWNFILSGDELEYIRSSGTEHFFYFKLQFDKKTPMILSRVMAIIRSLEEDCDFVRSDPYVDYIEEEFEDTLRLFIASVSDKKDLVDMLTANGSKIIDSEEMDLDDLEGSVISQDSELNPYDDLPGKDKESYDRKRGDEKDLVPGSTSQGVVKDEKTDNDVLDKVDQNMGGEKRTSMIKEGYQETIRVSTEKLDSIMSLVGEMITNRTRSFELLEVIKSSYMGDEMVERLKESLIEEERIVSELQDSVMKSRMVPIGLILKKVPMIVRNLSREAGKKVYCEISGETTELDKNLVDILWEPLVHIIRNAVDHGIETTGERREAGKSETGHISIKAHQEYNKIVIEVEDDGRGIDTEKLIKKARENKIIENINGEISQAQIEDIIFCPGISTSDKITNISGRGVGMDIVKKTIERLSGTTEISSEKGKGTTILIRLPLTLAIIRSVFVEVGGGIFALPISDIVELLKFDSSDIRENHLGTRIFELRGEILEIFTLGELLGEEKREFLPEIVKVVVVRNRQSKVGIIVEGFNREREIVIKSMNGSYMNIEGVSGATIMGDGSVVLVLDVHILLERMRKRAGSMKKNINFINMASS